MFAFIYRFRLFFKLFDLLRVRVNIPNSNIQESSWELFTFLDFREEVCVYTQNAKVKLFMLLIKSNVHSYEMY